MLEGQIFPPNEKYLKMCSLQHKNHVISKIFVFIPFWKDQQMLNSCDELQCGARGVLYIVATPLVWSGCPEFSQVNERKKNCPFFLGGGGGREYMYFPYFFFTITLLI